MRAVAVTVQDIDRILETLANWEPLAGTAPSLQAGDVGWLMRFGREKAASELVQWVDEAGHPAAIGFREGANALWLAMDPGKTDDVSLAEAMLDWCESQRGEGPYAVDGPLTPAVWRQVFAAHGYEATKNVWTHLWMPLGPEQIMDVPGVENTSDGRFVEQRVAIQRSAFEGSTFTEERWRAMAQEAGFDPRFDLVAFNDTGDAVSAATCWFLGEGKCARLEPMGTHADHRRQGHGRRLLQAMASALASAGASGISVTTPASNVAAVEVYRASGFRFMGYGHAMEIAGTTPPD